MRKKIFTLLALFAGVLGANAQVAIQDVEMVPGGQTKINLVVPAEQKFLGCSFDLALPTGVTPVTETKTLPADNETDKTVEKTIVKCDLSAELTAADTYVFTNEKDGVYKFVVLPTNALTGVTCPAGSTVLSVYVTAPSEVTFSDGVASVDQNSNASNIVFAAIKDSQLADEKLDAPLAIKFKTYRLGDVTKTGEIDVDDYLGVAGLILSNTYSVIGDVKADGQVDVDDYLGVASIILNGSASAPTLKIANEIEPE